MEGFLPEDAVVSVCTHPLIAIFSEVVDELEGSRVQLQLMPKTKLLLSPLLLELYHRMHLNNTTVVFGDG